MDLFIFFVLPLATILLSIVLQKTLRSPILVAITFFAIYLIVAFAVFSSNLSEALIATIAYTILAFVTASIVRLIKMIRANSQVNDESTENNDTSCGCNNRGYSNQNIATIFENNDSSNNVNYNYVQRRMYRRR